MARVTLASVDQKLESFMELVRQHMEDDTRLFDRIAEALDGNGKPGIKTRIELNEKAIVRIDESRTLQAKAVWSTLVAIVAAIITKFMIG